MTFRRVLPTGCAGPTARWSEGRNPDERTSISGRGPQAERRVTLPAGRWSATAALMFSVALGAASFAFAGDAPSSGPAAAKAAIETGPALGWVFPVFTDKEGYHEITLRGSTARLVNADQIDVTGFSAVRFSGDASERVDSVLISPRATFRPKEMVATGDSTVRLIRDDAEVTGRGWSYDDKAKRVSIEHDVRVTFRAPINDILK